MYFLTHFRIFLLRGGHGLGAIAGGCGLLDCDLRAVAQTDVGLCVWP